MGTKKLANKPETKTSKDFHVELAFLYLVAQLSLQISQLPGPYVRQSILFLLLPPTNFEQD